MLLLLRCSAVATAGKAAVLASCRPWSRPGRAALPLLVYPSLVRNLATGGPGDKGSSKPLTVEQSFEVLGVARDASEVEIRAAYLELAKEWHPDAGKAECGAKFAQIGEAYRIASKSTEGGQPGSPAPSSMEEFWAWYEQQLEEMEELEKYRHKAPQHRQYLEYNAGVGSVSKRQKQSQQRRAAKAYDDAMERKVSKLMASDSVDIQVRKKARRDRVVNAVDRLVEDLIQEAMSRGEFQNLKYAGKPLPEKTLHYVDRTSEKLNEFLINSGCLPDWIEKDKEIRSQVAAVRQRLEAAWQSHGPQPMSPDDAERWNEQLADFREKVVKINKKIRDYNLVCPTPSQKMHILPDREIERVMATEIAPPSPESSDANQSDRPAEGHDAAAQMRQRWWHRLKAKWSRPPNA